MNYIPINKLKINKKEFENKNFDFPQNLIVSYRKKYCISSIVISLVDTIKKRVLWMQLNFLIDRTNRFRKMSVNTSDWTHFVHKCSKQVLFDIKAPVKTPVISLNTKQNICSN